jgi:hypothetical protein
MQNFQDPSFSFPQVSHFQVVPMGPVTGGAGGAATGELIVEKGMIIVCPEIVTGLV